MSHVDMAKVAEILASRLACDVTPLVEEIIQGLRGSADSLKATDFGQAYSAAADLVAEELAGFRSLRRKQGRCPECGGSSIHRSQCPNHDKPVNPVTPMEDGGYAEASDRR